MAQRKIDAESLNDDLKELGLTTFIRPNYSGFYILPIGSTLNNGYGNYTEIYVHYKTSHHIERKSNYLTRDIPTKFCVGIQTRNHSYTDKFFPTFQDFIKSEKFKDSLKSIYQQNLKVKKQCN